MECPNCGSFTLSYVSVEEDTVIDDYYQCQRCDSIFDIDEFDMESSYDD